jgi:hypothetical protein
MTKLRRTLLPHFQYLTLQSVSVTIIDYQSGKQCRLDVVLVDGVDSQDVELSGLVVVG